MNVQDFLSIAIVGAALAMAVQFIKNRYGLNSLKTKALTLGLAITVGAAFYFLSQTAWWQAILGVLAAASTFWAFLLKGESGSN